MELRKFDGKSPSVFWDTSEFLEAQVRYLMEEEDPKEVRDRLGLEPGEPITKAAVEAHVMDDQTLMDFEWESVSEALSDILEKYSPDGVFYATGKDLGWRKLTGKSFIDTRERPCKDINEAACFLDKLLPRTDNTWYLYEYKDHFVIVNYHHDAPTGETYRIYPAWF